MTIHNRFGCMLVAALLASIFGYASATHAQATPSTGAAARPATAPARATVYRKLAPGVMVDVDTTKQMSDTWERHDITELLHVDQNFDFAKDAIVRHDIWMLEFKYKPVRMITADVPGPNLRMQRKQIWYMVYEVTNPGKAYHPVADSDQTFKLDTVDKPLRFMPLFTLDVHTRLQGEVTASGKVYNEKYLPIVIPAIRAREDKNRDFVSSFDMPGKVIDVGKSIWGVAVWEDIDPQNVWFSVNVEGLTNATKYKDDPAKYASKAGPYREIVTKVLKLNFWRPGDEYKVEENQVRLGTPSLSKGSPGLPPSEWVWQRIYPTDK